MSKHGILNDIYLLCLIAVYNIINYMRDIPN